MTIALPLSNPVQYLGNGSAVSFSYPWKVFAATDVVVGFIVGGQYTQQLAGFTVNGVGSNGGGAVVFAVAPPLGVTVDLRSAVPETQPTEFANLGAYLPENTTGALDRVTRALQDLFRRAYTFAIHGPDTELTAWPALPNAAGRANTFVGFDINGLPTIAALLPTALTQSQFNAFLASAPIQNIYPQTQAEALAGVLPVNFAMAPGTIDRYFVNSPAGGVDATPGFNAAIAQAQQLNGATVVLAGPYLLNTSITIPVGVSVYATDAATITGPSSVTFTINGQFFAPRVPVFPGPWPGSMPIVFAAGSCAEAYPEWFGCVANSTTDCTTAFAALITACSGGSGVNIGIIPVRLASGYYLTGNQILTPAFTLRGTGRKTSGFTAKAGTSGMWFTDNGNAAGIILEDFAWYGNSATCPLMTHLGRFGYGASQHGSEGYFRGIWPRDCACSGGGWHLDINANVGFYDLISIYGNNAQSAGSNLLRIVGAGNMASKLALLGAGTNAYSLYINGTGSVVHGVEIEAPGNCSSSFAPLSVQEGAHVYGCIISLNNATPTTFDHLVEVGASATEWGLEGLQLFNAAGLGTVTSGNIYNIAKATYFGGTLQSTVGNGQGTGSYVAGLANVLSGTATFAAGTAVNVTLPWSQYVSNYKVQLGGNAAGYCWVTNKTVNGFTINCSGSNSNTTDWSVTL